jgi:carbon starvation protein
LLRALLWVGISVLGAGAYAAIAFKRGEALNSAYLLVAALCTFAIGFRFYSKWVAARVLVLDPRRAPPAEVHDDGKDFVKTNPWIVFGHHFAAISGPGPLVGPVLAAQFGYLPGTLWILIGCVLGGAVQDFVILFASMRRDGKSLGQMVKEELNTTAGYIALVAILSIMLILLAVLALVVVKALAESPWGVFTVGATIPIAMFMGSYMRFLRIGRVLEASAIGVVLLLLAVWGGQYVYTHPELKAVFKLKEEPLAWAIIGYGLAASVLPVWLLLAPRDYLSTFMKLGTIGLLALGCFLVLPDLQMPALTQFVDGSGLVFAGKLFPFCFITIACGAISGFHTLISSGTTPKLITREHYARPIGYGAMCLESLVAIMAMVAACTLEPGVYLSMNIKGAGATPEARAAATVEQVNATGFAHVTVEQMETLAKEMGEDTLFGRTGGAATLAVGMAMIFHKAVGERWMDLWYHFAIMFEALFILTTLDAGTRVGRYILQDFLGNLWKPLGETRRLGANLVASLLMVSGWGYFLIQGVRDPLGGINSLWPLFGIANQMLAAIALCLATTIILKMQLAKTDAPTGNPKSEIRNLKTRSHEPNTTNQEQRTGNNEPIPHSAFRIPRSTGRPWLALVTLVPLAWLVAVTGTAAIQKIAHPDPRIGFLAAAKDFGSKAATLEATRSTLAGEALAKADVELKRLRTLRFNNQLDAAVAASFMALLAIILLLSVREWILLLARKKLAELRETPPTWLSDYALAEAKPLHFFGLFTLAVALARELSGEAEFERAQQLAAQCECADHLAGPAAKGRLFVAVTNERYRSIRRCC